MITLRILEFLYILKELINLDLRQFSTALFQIHIVAHYSYTFFLDTCSIASVYIHLQKEFNLY